MGSPQPTEPNVAAFEEGINGLKSAAVVMIIAAVLTGFGALASVTTFISSFTAGHPPSAVVKAFGGVAAADVLGGVAILIATFPYLFKAFDKLREFNPGKFGTPATIVKIGFPAYGLMTVIAPIATYVLVSQLMTGTPGFATIQQVVGTLQTIKVLAFIAGAAAMVGIGLGTYYVYEVSNEGLYLAAAILFFLAIFISILAFIAWILVIAGVSNAISKVRAAYATPGTQGPSATPSA